MIMPWSELLSVPEWKLRLRAKIMSVAEWLTRPSERERDLWSRVTALGEDEEVNAGTTDAEYQAILKAYFPEEEYSHIREAHLAAFRRGR